MKNWIVELSFKGHIVDDLSESKTNKFEYSFSHKGPITLVICNAIEKASEMVGQDLTNYVKSVDAQEL